MIERRLPFSLQHRIDLRGLRLDQRPRLGDVLRNPVRVRERTLNKQVDRRFPRNLGPYERRLRVLQVREDLLSVVLHGVRRGDRVLTFLQRGGLMGAAHHFVGVELFGSAPLHRMGNPVRGAVIHTLSQPGTGKCAQRVRVGRLLAKPNQRVLAIRGLRVVQVADQMLSWTLQRSGVRDPGNVGRELPGTAERRTDTRHRQSVDERMLHPALRSRQLPHNLLAHRLELLRMPLGRREHGLGREVPGRKDLRREIERVVHRTGYDGATEPRGLQARELGLVARQLRQRRTNRLTGSRTALCKQSFGCACALQLLRDIRRHVLPSGAL